MILNEIYTHETRNATIFFAAGFNGEVFVTIARYSGGIPAN
jgi:hypothetical protein